MTIKQYVMKIFNKILILMLLVGLNSCNKGGTVEVSQATIEKHMERLSSDEFLGRMPFTEGETKTVKYLSEEFAKLGLMPANGDSYFQEVPMIEIDGTPSEKMTITNGINKLELGFYDDFVATSPRTDSQVILENSELVFAGYGVVAPEYNWNDYEGIDWEGKTAVVLINDPGFQSGDTSLFNGNAMTYYGRWTYKYEEAARQGADGIIIIHETEPASYGWGVVQSGWTGPQLTLESNLPVTKIESWISNGSAEKLFQMSALKDKDYKEMAQTRGFKPVPMGLKVSLHISNKVKRDVSKNVIAVLPGTDLKDEYIIYSAHWDHLGVGRPVDNDSIYNGAIDNASGTASLFAIAEAFKASKPSKRSVVFFATTGEEQGLLGSAYYAENPLFPPEKTVADINMDALNVWGPMKDLTIMGYGQSELDEYARTEAENMGRYILPDPHPENGYFYRADHFSFAKIGIPALYAKGSYEGMEISIEKIKELDEYYETYMYHQPLDEYDPETMDISGVQFDAQLLFQLGYRLSNEDYFPKWNDKSEFKSVRENN
jgi:Zn-dependent M28 family amino/carboxypeptidase